VGVLEKLADTVAVGVLVADQLSDTLEEGVEVDE
jgi:hypothetical protein